MNRNEKKISGRILSLWYRLLVSLWLIMVDSIIIMCGYRMDIDSIRPPRAKKKKNVRRKKKKRKKRCETVKRVA